MSERTRMKARAVQFQRYISMHGMHPSLKYPRVTIYEV